MTSFPRAPMKRTFDKPGNDVPGPGAYDPDNGSKRAACRKLPRRVSLSTSHETLARLPPLNKNTAGANGGESGAPTVGRGDGVGRDIAEADGKAGGQYDAVRALVEQPDGDVAALKGALRARDQVIAELRRQLTEEKAKRDECAGREQRLQADMESMLSHREDRDRAVAVLIREGEDLRDMIVQLRDALVAKVFGQGHDGAGYPEA
ncbi:uncharacterized protein LOC129591758 [Paramacrobiotus metropolitanus]|uniref:uncharacterized protein LOC129591758 n=1 Tax=Paramacrobiotus metropolitanus TaxID=2943436 RepID=UPI0024464075|nr:uncharacterized protein LOC129591758 [Paramacrobiotus metropolitanus]